MSGYASPSGVDRRFLWKAVAAIASFSVRLLAMEATRSIYMHRSSSGVHALLDLISHLLDFLQMVPLDPSPELASAEVAQSLLLKLFSV